MPGKTILVVEDNDAIRRAVVDALSFEGYQILESIDGVGAMTVVSEGAPDLVLLDVRLPGADGFQILEEIRDARRRLTLSEEGLRVARSVIEQAEENLRQVKDLFTEGKVRAQEVLEAEALLSAERAQEARAIYEGHRSLERLRFALGLEPEDSLENAGAQILGDRSAQRSAFYGHPGTLAPEPSTVDNRHPCSRSPNPGCGRPGSPARVASSARTPSACGRACARRHR